MSMKAWICTTETPKTTAFSTVIFAETRGQAISFAMSSDQLEEPDYIDVRARRFVEADGEYRGRQEMDWDANEEDRRFLVSHGWRCNPEMWEPEDCEGCGCADICEYAKEYKEDERR